MSIHYAATVESSAGGKRKSPALDKLALIAESFQSQGINVLNEGFGEVAVSTHFFRDYTGQLTEDMSPECAEQFEVLAENVRREVLVESNISGMSAVTALSLPLLRIAFPKTSVREGLPTEPVTQPKFTVKWFRPYVVISNGVKQYLPKALRDVNTQGMFHLPKMYPVVALTSGQAIGYDLYNVPVGPAYAAYTPGSRALNDQIDPNFSISHVTGKIGGVTVAEVPVAFKIDTLTNVCEGLVTLVGATETMEARIFAKVNRETGYADIITAVTSVVTTIGGAVQTIVPADDAITEIKFEGYLSSEMNNRAAQIGFEITDDPTTIGTGQPIESPINIQQMTDAMAMYNIDTTMRHLEIMSTTLAQVVDIEGIGFIVNQFSKVPSALQATYTESFNRTPSGTYALGPTAWREELKIQIDSLVVKMMNETNYTSGSIVLFGNPIDIQVINNVRWTYSSEEAPNGVNVDYRLGVYTSGVTTFKVLSSFNWPACSAGGYIYVVFIPNEQDQKTVAYYPYSYHVLRGQASPNNVNLPSIQMIKRQAFREYTPMIGRISIV